MSTADPNPTPPGNPPPNPNPPADPNPNPAASQTFSFPDGIPDQYRGKDWGDTVGKMWPALDGFIKKQSEFGQVPKDATAYAWTPPEQLAGLVGDQGRDVYVQTSKAAALKAGMSDKQYQTFMNELGDGLFKARPQGDAPFQPEDNSEIRQGNFAWIDNMKAQGAFTDAEARQLDILAVDKAGSSLLAKLQQRFSPGFEVKPGDGQPGNGEFGVPAPRSLAEVNKLMDDPRYDTRSQKFDKAFRTYVDDARMKLVNRPAS